MTSAAPLLPTRQLSASDFVKIDPIGKIEEEDLPSYVAENYYPVHIGEVFASRYQVVSKLGYGMSSTAWLCRDLRQEIAVSDHLKKARDHFGKRLVRLVLDSFDISGPHGNHTCLVYQPLGMSFTELQHLCPDSKLPRDLLQKSVQLTLISLAFVHENDVIGYTKLADALQDVSTNNILQGVGDTSVLRQIEEDEISRPVARKILDDREIYFSRPVPISEGLPVLSDFGEARIGKAKQRGDVMPGIYRAPEVILDREWNNKVDIWSIGVMVSLACSSPPFEKYAH
ncbi:hypothetical protein N7454_007138 [Penicillium verhagenii]|nr:hypothetical protein N7454_007138 [Penicillium verhagenii]